MIRQSIIYMGLAIILVLAGCQDEAATEGELPTLIVVPTDTPEPTPTVDAPQADDLPDATDEPQDDSIPSEAESSRPTLPPTFTPEATNTPLPTRTPRPTEEPLQLSGTLYYILNNAQIIAQNGPDDIQIRFDFGPNGVDDLTFSPDGSLMAFVAPGNGSAREVFIASPDGSYIQQVSCLGQADVQQPTWSPDGERIAWVAGQTVGTPLDVYVANWVGSNQCPDGNNQRQLRDANITIFGDLTFSTDGEYVFYSDIETYALDLADGSLAGPLTSTLGFGPDYNLAFPPEGANTLAYIQVNRSPTESNGVPVGNLVLLDATNPDDGLQELNQRIGIINSLTWLDGERILVTDGNTIYIASASNLNTNMIAEEVTLIAAPVLASDNRQMIYFEAVPELPGTRQGYIIDLEGSQMPVPSIQITGDITHLHWFVGEN